ncbi:MAG: Ribonuclease 3 [Candidatus Curtissbacteria bacterium GW2011_GWA1_40_9]|uniref:Ribonuclease 3 n=1 Tax=Candidatus Curtissbacteria bacterium GW2011_GWA1_40_9 TaxID=1618408 RepID=A0A0G0TU04_9BACT|nr:MAG: Ribonuclease 3 [Candidatus Curtissbacteria bacterium GW2011_GWA1_40_9]
MKTSTRQSKPESVSSLQKPNLTELQDKISISFKDQNLLKNAFIHRSYLNEHKDFQGQSNERMEFLGDSVLSLVVSMHLFGKLPQSPEGELTQYRAALVRTETLASLAKDLNLGSYLLLSKGEEDTGGRTNKSILANTFEALIGAIYLDQGIEPVQQFITKTILLNWKKLIISAVIDNKSKLQEALQKRYHESPSYNLISSWGPDHARNFEMGVYLKTKLLGKGVGKNKQEAAQKAAQDALAKIKSAKVDVKT